MLHHATSRRRFVTAVGLGGLTVAGAGVTTARGHNRNFRTHLSGENEVPPVDTNAQGQAKFQLNNAGDELSYKLIVANIDDVFAAHIHRGSAGTNGPVVVWLYPEDGPPAELIDGRVNGVLAEGTITAGDLVGPLGGEPFDDLVSAIRSGNTYVNVHTTAHPGGEIRGQIQ